MSEWYYIDVNKNMIKYDTGKAVLIACPSSSDYSGYCFWHPKSCVKEGRHSAALCISFTEEWEFHLTNKKTEDEQVVDYHELSEIMSCLDCDIDYGRKKPNPYETHRPVYKAPEKVEVLDELLDC